MGMLLKLTVFCITSLWVPAGRYLFAKLFEKLFLFYHTKAKNSYKLSSLHSIFSLFSLLPGKTSFISWLGILYRFILYPQLIGFIG
jgi:hypothetical protein